MKFPSIADVAAQLRNVNKSIRADRGPETDLDMTCDIRLQVYPDGSWAIRVGDASYDQDHRGYWGASSLDGKRFDSRAAAKDLIEQAREQHAGDQS